MSTTALAIFIVLTGTTTTFAQTAYAPVTKDSVTENQKFYFPSNNYTDSVALIRAIPKLAEQVLSVYHERK
jgi:hypothetical protein